MKHFLCGIACYLVMVLQTTFLPTLRTGDIGPDFFFIVMALFLFTWSRESRSTVVWAAIFGFCRDCLSAEPLGPGMILAVAGCFLVDICWSSSMRQTFWGRLCAGGLLIALLTISTEVQTRITAGQTVGSLKQLIDIGWQAGLCTLYSGLLFAAMLILGRGIGSLTVWKTRRRSFAT